MEEMKRLASILVEEILDEPDAMSCTPYTSGLNSGQMLSPRAPSLELSSSPEKLSLTNGLCTSKGHNNEKKQGKKPWTKPWCPLPNPPVPVTKSELRGGVHYPKCECVKRNGLQDSCMSYGCWVTFNQEGCASTPWATCPLARQQLEKYGALANQCPTDKPPCGVCVEQLTAQKQLRNEKERRCALGGQPGFDDDGCSDETALGDIRQASSRYHSSYFIPPCLQRQ